ncbi:hypothetical protein ABB26_11580 [Stenotrophomonas humi]|uniref:Uncharacterized protein n=1 Tax=Stenotrophomonas humi TaxID=405444 RepID=A0A0R0CA69_9GAMM|nr:hypothetical protein ABB26_11580 [Stenotrophomonas humi]
MPISTGNGKRPGPWTWPFGGWACLNRGGRKLERAPLREYPPAPGRRALIAQRARTPGFIRPLGSSWALMASSSASAAGSRPAR